MCKYVSFNIVQYYLNVGFKFLLTCFIFIEKFYTLKNLN